MATKAVGPKVLAADGKYTLTFSNGRYIAGCRNFSKDEAIRHWEDRPKGCGWDGCCVCARAKLFLDAIHAFNRKKKAPKKSVRKAA
jgi:hypothetical protein